MKRKIVGLLTATLLAFVCIPTIANAEEVASDCEEQNIICASATGVCHCGGLRYEEVYERKDSVYCEEHGATCLKKYGIYERTYYYCSNPSCGDNYYGAWCLVFTGHYL